MSTPKMVDGGLKSSVVLEMEGGRYRRSRRECTFLEDLSD